MLISIHISAQVFVEMNSPWSYFKGTAEPSTPTSLWANPEFNVSDWPVGNTPFRYGDGNGGTLLSDMQNNYTTLFLRKQFNVNNPDSIDQLAVSINYDDGFIVWLNGKIILQNNAPAKFRLPANCS